MRWLALLLMLVACEADPGGSSLSVGTGGDKSFAESCSTHADCGAGLVCVTNACQSAFPRTYTLTLYRAHIAPKNGKKNWDTFTGPDPVAAIFVDGENVCETPILDDTFIPVWNHPCDVQLFESSEVTVVVEEDDDGKNDPIGSVNLGRPLADEYIKSGQFDSPVGVSKLEGLIVYIGLK